MGIIGLDEDFSRRANTRQITGAGGLPLMTEDRDVLVTRNGVEKAVANIPIDVSLSTQTNSAYTESFDSAHGATAIYVYLEATDPQDGVFQVEQTVRDEDDNNLGRAVPPQMEAIGEIDTSMPIRGDDFEITVQNVTSEQSSIDIVGNIFLTQGGISDHAASNKLGIKTGQDTASNSGEEVTLNGGNTAKIPDGGALAIKALSGNSGTVYIRSAFDDSTADGSNGVPLGAGESLSDLAVKRVDNITFYAPNSGDGVAWVAEGGR